jgi:hypothetical protein
MVITVKLGLLNKLIMLEVILKTILNALVDIHKRRPGNTLEMASNAECTCSFS